MIDLRRYYRVYPNKSCWVEKTETAFMVRFKRFDNETGIELPQEYQHFTIDEIESEITDLSNKLDAAKSILFDAKHIE